MARFRRGEAGDSAACYELARRALAEQDQEAWAAFYAQYHGLVRYWLSNVPDDAEALIDGVFERFWHAVPPTRFPDFPSLDRLLASLKRCAQSMAIDARRKAERQAALESALAEEHAWVVVDGPAPLLQQALDRAADAQLAEQLIVSRGAPRRAPMLTPSTGRPSACWACLTWHPLPLAALRSSTCRKSRNPGVV